MGSLMGQIYVIQRGFISDYYKVKSIDQWGKLLVMAMGFVNHLGLYYSTQLNHRQLIQKKPLTKVQVSRKIRHQSFRVTSKTTKIFFHCSHLDTQEMFA